MKFGSLFAGIGGIDLGLEMAGMTCAWQVEVDPFCQRVLKKHWPDVPLFGDVREIDTADLDDVDLIAGGFPCPPVSNAYPAALGEDDERWLWPEFYRIICDLRPEWVLVENVPGLRSKWDGRIFGGILRDLASVRYDAEWESISAQAIGAPHLRWRVFIVAHTERMGRTEGASGTRRSGNGRASDFVSNASQTPRTTSKVLQDTDREGLEGSPRKGVQGRSGIGVFTRTSHVRPRSDWSVEPDVGRVAHGVSNRVDKLRGLGNAVVPQIAHWIGERIYEAHSERRSTTE